MRLHRHIAGEAPYLAPSWETREPWRFFEGRNMPDICITDYLGLLSVFGSSFVFDVCVPNECKHGSAISRAVAAPSPGADDVSSGTPRCETGAASFLLEGPVDHCRDRGARDVWFKRSSLRTWRPTRTGRRPHLCAAQRSPHLACIRCGQMLVFKRFPLEDAALFVEKLD